ncbi:MAG: ABC transporter substrate-binding protein [Actinomycetota bacterium]|nr:ABC transporter substrate-binding protein [Actinomycetota bacterium]MDA3013413.1 ABC transporter substrate-binding protein [Actinomycetota bacterium]
MKLKIFILAAIFSMCTNTSDNASDIKIVSLSTTHTEIIDSLGAAENLVGIDSFYQTDLPIKRIDAYTVSAEDLKPLDPDLVVIAFDFNNIIEGLEKNNINYIVLPPAKNLEEVYFQIQKVGELVQKEQTASFIVDEMKTKINSLIKNNNFGKVSVFHEIGYSYGLYTVNQNALIGDIYNTLGVTNIANLEVDIYGSGYPQYTDKKVIEANPDFIIVGHSDYLNKDLSTRPGWNDLKAVSAGNVYFLDENLANNWGTTTLQLVENLVLTLGESNKKTEMQTVYLLISILVFIFIFNFGLKRVNRKTKEKI